MAAKYKHVTPDELTLVTDPNDPLYDPRVHEDPDEDLAKNIATYGIIEPVIVKEDGTVIAGRRRVKAAKLANEKLESEGAKALVKVPVLVRGGEGARMVGVMVSENEQRRPDEIVSKARKAARMRDLGASVSDVANAFGVKPQTVHNWLKVMQLPDDDLAKIESGETSAMAAIQGKEPGGPGRGRPKSNALPRPTLRAVIARLEEDPAGEHETFVQGMKFALGEDGGETPEFIEDILGSLGVDEDGKLPKPVKGRKPKE